jgi:hypothetical protein
MKCWENCTWGLLYPEKIISGYSKLVCLLLLAVTTLMYAKLEPTFEETLVKLHKVGT